MVTLPARSARVFKLFSIRSLYPILRQGLALTLLWALVLGDFPLRVSPSIFFAHANGSSAFARSSVARNWPTAFDSLANNEAWRNPAGSPKNASSIPLSVTPKTPKALSAEMPPSSDLVAAYSFEEGSGTTTADSSGNNNTGTLSSGVTWTTGKIGNGVAFNGISGDITVNEAPSLDLNGSFTLSAWVEPAIVSGSQTLLIKEATRASCGYYLQIVDREIDGGFNNGSGCVDHITSNANLSAGNWYHIVVVLDHGSNKYNTYLNGSLISSVAERKVPRPNTQTLLLGRSACDTCGFERLNGVLDEVNIYNRALSASEVQTLYTAGNPGLTITGLNPCSWTRPPRICRSPFVTC